MDLTFFVAALALFASADRTYSADSCPALYERYCAQHSSCLPASSCDIKAQDLTQEEKDLVLKLHNDYRNKLAVGDEVKEHDMPAAANMMQLEWDDELAANSQKYAQQCIYAHDKPNCRKVKNFRVGQNIAFQTLIGGHDVPEPDWRFAMDAWYSEIKYFGRKDIYPFHKPEKEEFQHFSQLVWADTFRVGCGYVLYKTENNLGKLNLTRLYVCEYGPTGNNYGARMYEEGDACSHCPINSCCGQTCTDGNAYAALCKRTDAGPPRYPPPQPNLFYCSFQPDCDYTVTGSDGWTIEKALSGNYISLVLKGGETSTLSFKKAVQPTASSFCAIFFSRSGPNKDVEEYANKAFLVLDVPAAKYTYPQLMPEYSDPGRQYFAGYNLTASWNLRTEMQLKFEVPADKPDQFFEVQSLTVVDGKCQ